MVLHDARYGNYETGSRICFLRTVPLEDRIRELCARAVDAPPKALVGDPANQMDISAQL